MMTCVIMPLLKAQKKELAKKYLSSVEGAKNAVVLSVEWIPVNEVNNLRMDLAETQGNLEVIKKRVFLKGIEGKFDGFTLDQAPGSIAILYSHNEDDIHAPLKVINKHQKVWKKAKETFSIDYIGWWYDSIRQDKSYVAELAALPSKEELVGKFLYMLNHPVSSFARVLQAIADKDGDTTPTEESIEKPTEEITPAESEAPAEEPAE